jgi:hypothetical protein
VALGVCAQAVSFVLVLLMLLLYNLPFSKKIVDVGLYDYMNHDPNFENID